MAVFKCKLCGGTVEFEEGATVGVCDSCGTKQTLPGTDEEESVNSSAKEMADSNGGPSAASLLRRAFLFLESSNWHSANEYCEKVLDIEPENAQAYLCKLMAELGVHAKEELKDCAEPFDEHDSYQKVLRFADPDLVEELKNDIAFINKRNEEARLNSIYDSAVRAMESARTEKEFKAAALTFKSIPGFRDADNLAEQCLEKAEICRKDEIYASGKAKMDNPEASIVGYKRAIDSFQKIPGWKDADELIDVCRQKIKDIEARLREEARMAEERRIAEAEAEKREKRISAIILSAFIAGAIVLIVLTTVIIPSIRYNTAVGYYNEGNYQEAYDVFRKLSYKDSEELAAKCSQVIQYDSAMELYHAGKYQEAYEVFHSLVSYKDSENRAKECILFVLKEKLPKVRIGDIIKFGCYEQDNDISNGEEPIEWLVLDIQDDKALVVSQYALDCRAVNTSLGHWGTCSLRSWLKKNFLKSAFTQQDRELIAQDQVFLLSSSEVKNYFASDKKRRCVPTAYALAQGAEINSEYGTVAWWLRSTTGDGKFHYVKYNGEVKTSSSWHHYANSSPLPIRPAMWISLDS